MVDHPGQATPSSARTRASDGSDPSGDAGSAPTESFAAASGSAASAESAASAGSAGSAGSGATAAGAARTVPGGVGAPGRAAPQRVLAPQEEAPTTALATPAGTADRDAAPTTAQRTEHDDDHEARSSTEHEPAFETFSPDEAGVVAPEPAVDTRRGTTGLGLLVLRLALGGILVAHSLQKLFGLFGGSGIDGFASLLESSGYSQPTALAWVGAISELVAGGLLVLGLLTPLAAAAALGVLVNAWFVREAGEPGFTFFAAQGGTELEILLVALAAAVALTGPGRISLDARRRWATRPSWDAIAALVVGAGSGVGLWFLLNGANPFA